MPSSRRMAEATPEAVQTAGNANWKMQSAPEQSISINFIAKICLKMFPKMMPTKTHFNLNCVNFRKEIPTLNQKKQIKNLFFFTILAMQQSIWYKQYN